MAFDPTDAYRLHPQVALRPEPFGALAYHYGNRKLVFLKTAKIVDVVRTLGDYDSVDDALAGAGVPLGRRPTYVQALADLERSEIICAATR